jgi:lipoyl-dependent peroxiredoxin
MAAERRAEVTWNGDLFNGSGTIENVGSGAFGPLDVTWASRTEDSGGKTSPEELIAAAHASCFSMAFSNVLAKAGTPPEQLKTSATVTFVPGTGITTSVLEVEGSVPGLDEEGFLAAAEDAKENCPVSQALKNNVEVSVNARLTASVGS